MLAEDTMARKSEIDQFLAEVLETIPEDRRASFEETLRMDGVSKAVRERVLARSDYSRKSDELAAREKQVNDYLQGEQTKIAGWANWYEDAVKAAAAQKEALDSYKATFGELDSSKAKPKFVTKEDFDAEVNARLQQEMNKRDANAIKFADILTDMKIDYKADFGKRLDTDALIKYATENGLPLQAAYDRFTAEDRNAKQEKVFEERIEAAKKEAVKEALSNHKLPFQPGPTEPHVLDIQKDVPKNRADRVAAAISDWNSTDHKSFF